MCRALPGSRMPAANRELGDHGERSPRRSLRLVAAAGREQDVDPFDEAQTRFFAAVVDALEDHLQYFTTRLGGGAGAVGGGEPPAPNELDGSRTGARAVSL